MNVLLDRWAYSHVQFLRKRFLEATGDKGEKELDKKGFFKLFAELQDMPKAVAESAFRMFDTDNSGKLNFREFCCALALCCHLMSSDDEKIRFVFDMFDTNDDNLLSATDVQLLLDAALQKDARGDDSRSDEKDTAAATKRQQRVLEIKQELLGNSQHLTWERFSEWAQLNIDSLNNLLHTFQIVPSPERERAICEEILSRHQSLQEGSTWYCISHKWLQVWKAHAGWTGPSPGRRVQSIGSGSSSAGVSSLISGQRDRAGSGDSTMTDPMNTEDAVALMKEVGMGSAHHMLTRPPEIDNSDLEGEHKGELKMNLVEHLDYELIPEEMWLKLVEWYGGGPVILRKVICMGQDQQPQVELYPPLVLVVVAGENGQPLPQFSRRFFISRQSSLAEVLQMLAEKLSKPVDRSRLWHRVKGEQWRPVQQMSATLEEFLEGKVWDAGAFLLETQTAAGEWPRDALPAAEASEGSAAGGTLADRELQRHFEVGDRVEAQSGVTNQWMRSTIVDVIQRDHSSAPSQVKVHYDSTVYKCDEWISTSSDRLAPLDTHTSGKDATGSTGAVSSLEGPPIRGATGLQNLGNTCFLNATIQCMVNTPLMKEYFLSTQYLRDINEKGFGCKGRLAEEFGHVLTDIWAGKNTALTPRNLKRTIDQFAPQFAGYEQHDAQELLAFFLDGLHEDLNRSAPGGASGSRGGSGSRREASTPKLLNSRAKPTRSTGTNGQPVSPKRAKAAWKDKSGEGTPGGSQLPIAEVPPPQAVVEMSAPLVGADKDASSSELNDAASVVVGGTIAPMAIGGAPRASGGIIGGAGPTGSVADMLPEGYPLRSLEAMAAEAVNIDDGADAIREGEREGPSSAQSEAIHLEDSGEGTLDSTRDGSREGSKGARSEDRLKPWTATRPGGDSEKQSGTSQWWSFAWRRGRGALDLPKELNGEHLHEGMGEKGLGKDVCGAEAGGHKDTDGLGSVGLPGRGGLEAADCRGQASSTFGLGASLGRYDGDEGAIGPLELPREASGMLEELRAKLPAGAAASAVAAARACEVSEDGMSSTTFNESEDFVPELLTPQQGSYRRSLSLLNLNWRKKKAQEEGPGSPKRRPRTPPTMMPLREEQHEDRSPMYDVGPEGGKRPSQNCGAHGETLRSREGSHDSSDDVLAQVELVRGQQSVERAASREGRSRTKDKDSSAWPSFLRRSKSRDKDAQRRPRPAGARQSPAHPGDTPIADGLSLISADPEDARAMFDESLMAKVPRESAGLLNGTARVQRESSEPINGTAKVQRESSGPLKGKDVARPEERAEGEGNELAEERTAEEEPEEKEVDEDRLPDDEKAALQWERYRARNRSLIVDVFEGQLRSQLTCCKCGSSSSTFEPFRYLSVPIPSNHVDRATLRVVFFPLPFSRSRGEERQQLTRYSVTVPKSSTMQHVKHVLSSRLPVPMSSVLLAEVYRSRIHRYLDPALPLSDVRAEDQLFAFEILQTAQDLVSYQERHAPSRQKKDRPLGDITKEPQARVLLIQAMHRRVVDVCRSDGRTWAQRREVFGLPFVMSAASSWTYATLHDMLVLHARRFLKQARRDREAARRSASTDSLTPVEERQVPFVARIVNASGTACGACDRRNCTGCLLPKGSARLRLRAGLLTGAVNTAKIYLALDWVDSVVYDQEYVDSVADDVSVARANATEWQDRDGANSDTSGQPPPPPGDSTASQAAGIVPISACIDAFAQPEEMKVEMGNGVKCETCNEVVDAVKKLEVWREPDVLILHIKRFHFSGVHYEKLNTPVEVPWRELNLRPWIVGPSASNSAPYELYGVACHFGGMSGGHYTSYCANYEGKEPIWLKFNDEAVTSVSLSQDMEQISRQCYVLFYRKRAFSSSNLINYLSLM